MKRRIMFLILCCASMFFAFSSCSLASSSASGSAGDSGNETVAGISFNKSLSSLDENEISAIADEYGIDASDVESQIKEMISSLASPTVQDLISKINELKSDRSDDSDEEGGKLPANPVSEIALPGKFSISSSQKVRFSPGNLYWNGKGYEFEKKQQDFRVWGGDRALIDGKITVSPASSRGVFLWTPDAEKAHSEEAYNAVNSALKEDKLYNESWKALGLTSWNDPKGTKSFNETFFADKAEVMGSEWTNLTRDEWEYLLFKRTNADKKRKSIILIIGNVADEKNTYGWMLLPDDFEYPNVSDDEKWFTNGDKWSYMLESTLSEYEKNGAVFLATPTEGWFSGDEKIASRSSWFAWGQYWTNSIVRSWNDIYGMWEYGASCFSFDGETPNFDDAEDVALYYPYHCMVRLVNRI